MLCFRRVVVKGYTTTTSSHLSSSRLPCACHIQQRAYHESSKNHHKYGRWLSSSAPLNEPWHDGEDSEGDDTKPLVPHQTKQDLGKHYEAPDSDRASYQLSYSLSPLELEAFPSQLSNFSTAKRWFEQKVLDGNHESKQVYVDPNALQLFDAVFPEIAQSRSIGRIRNEHFDTWDYSTDSKGIQMEKAFAILDQDGSNAIERGEFDTIMERSGLDIVDEDDGGNQKNSMFDSIDKDGKGYITKQEFIEFWNSSNAQDQQQLQDTDRRTPKTVLREYLAGLVEPLVNNNVKVQLQPKDLNIDGYVDLLAVGGPSSYTAALAHKAQYPDKSVLHVVKNRLDSNADGSAYYYHERDAFPLYINRVNTGWYCVYADLHKRLRSSESLRDLCVQDRHHVKIAVNWWNILRNPWMVASIFIPNTWHAFQDLIVRQPKDSLMQQACLHSQRVPKIVETVCKSLGLPTRAFLVRDPDRAVYIGLKGAAEQASVHFDWLNKYANIPYHHLKDPSIFGKLVHEALAFDRDGALNPFMFENFQRAFDQVGIEYRQDWVLNRLFVQPDDKESHRLVGTAAEFSHCGTGEVKVIGFDKMTFSLGPSGSVVVDPTIEDSSSLESQETESSQIPEQSSSSSSSIVRDSLNTVHRTLARGSQAYKDTMWAAGSSSVCVIGIKRGAATGEKLDVFRKFIDGVNQHWTLIKEREVRVGGGGSKDDMNGDASDEKIYDFFCIQMTGGGNFPSRHTKPDFVLNLLHTTEAMFGLNNESSASLIQPGDIVYDIVQTRGCGRSVSARNTVGFSPIAKNVVSAYGLGGIGMTTAFSNGALQLQILEALEAEKGDQELAHGARMGQIGSTTSSQQSLQDFYGENIFEGVNYQAMIDDPQTVSRGLGIDTSVSVKENQWMMGTAAAAMTTTVLTFLSFL